MYHLVTILYLPLNLIMMCSHITSEQSLLFPTGIRELRIPWPLRNLTITGEEGVYMKVFAREKI